MHYRIMIPGVPVAQPRYKIANRGKYVGKYLPTVKRNGRKVEHPITAYRARVVQAARQVCSEPIQGAVAIMIRVVYPRPQKYLAKKYPDERLYYPSCPQDWDNIGKGICDSLNGIAYDDDHQICSVGMLKQMVGRDEEPHTYVELNGLGAY